MPQQTPQYFTIEQARHFLSENHLIEPGLDEIKIAGGTLTFDEIQKFYNRGVKIFQNVKIKFEEKDKHKIGKNPDEKAIEVTTLDGAAFVACHAEIEEGTRFVFISSKSVPDAPERIKLSLKNEAITKENILQKISCGTDEEKLRRDLWIQRIYLNSKYAVGNKQKEISGDALRGLLLNSKNTVQQKFVTVLNFTVIDCFDISDISFNHSTKKEKELVDGLLSLQFKDCHFTNGIKLPDFILNQCANKKEFEKKLSEKNVSSTVLTAVLNEAARSLETYIEKISPVTEQPKRKLPYLSASLDTHLMSPTVNTLYVSPKAFLTDLLNGKHLRGVIVSDPEALYEKLKAAYEAQQKRDIFPGFLKSKYFIELDKKYPDKNTNSVNIKLWEIADHVREKMINQNAIQKFLGIRSSTTYLAAKKVLDDLLIEHPVTEQTRSSNIATRQLGLGRLPLVSSLSIDENTLPRQSSLADSFYSVASVTRDTEAEKKAEARDILDHAISSFNSSDLLGFDHNTAQDREVRESREKKIVEAYKFLKTFSDEDAVKKYNNLLRDYIYPHYLKYVVYGERKVDECGNQTHYLRYNIIESLFRISHVVKDSESLTLLSNHRGEMVAGPQFFSSDSPLGKQFIQHCQVEWANMSLAILAEANCIDKEIMHVIPDELSVVEQKQLYLAALINRGEFSRAHYELLALQAAWPTIKLTKQISDAIQLLHAQASKEIQTSVQLDGVAARRFADFCHSALAKDKPICDWPLTRDMQSYYSTAMTTDNLAVTKVLCNLFDRLCSDLTYRITQADLDCLLKINKTTILLATPIEAQIAQLKKTLTSATNLSQSKKALIENLFLVLKDPSDHLCVMKLVSDAGEFDMIKTKIKIESAKLFSYDKIQWAMKTNVLPLFQSNEMPAQYKANKIGDADLDVNYIKYTFAYSIQGALRELNSVDNVEKIYKILQTLKSLLIKAHKKMESLKEDGKTFDSLITALDTSVRNIEEKWLGNIQQTMIFELPQQSEQFDGLAVGFKRF